MTDTIVALATAPGRAGVAVVRLSGPEAFDIASDFCNLPPVRKAALRILRDRDGNTIDQALVLAFDSEQSFTGERTVEFQTHGSPAVIDYLIGEITRDDRARIAMPGEFTRRALENDNLTLTEVEGLADLISAETEAQLSQAQSVFFGDASAVIENWRADLLRAMALIESTIDFADEDVPEDVSHEVSALLSGVEASFQKELSGYSAARKIRDGFVVAIVGRPNAGKSTLINAIAKREVALTSEIAGTTRDVLEVRVDLGGLAVTFLDTAGIRTSTDVIEMAGVERARQRAIEADLRIFLSDDGQFELQELYQQGDISVISKIDLHGGTDGISAVTGYGIGSFLETISKSLSNISSQAGSFSHARQNQAVIRAQSFLKAAQDAILVDDDIEIVAESLRLSVRSLDELIGRIGVEEILGEVFASFCIGK